MWGITLETLTEVCEQARGLAGADFDSWTMREVNNAIVKPLCLQAQTSLALHRSPGGLKAEVFVSHAWAEPFGQFVESIRSVYRHHARPPTLWICTFALVQSDDPTVIAAQCGAPTAPLDTSPFVRALQEAREFLVVRNTAVDLYTRLWCVCEVYFAHKFDLLPNRARITGADAFAGATTRCIDAKCYAMSDQVRILNALTGGGEPDMARVEAIDAMIQEFRAFTLQRES
jgi:hypothetical protein